MVKQLHLFSGDPYTQDPLCLKPVHWTNSLGLNWCPAWLQGWEDSATLHSTFITCSTCLISWHATKIQSIGILSTRTAKSKIEVCKWSSCLGTNNLAVPQNIKQESPRLGMTLKGFTSKSIPERTESISTQKLCMWIFTVALFILAQSGNNVCQWMNAC